MGKKFYYPIRDRLKCYYKYHFNDKPNRKQADVYFYNWWVDNKPQEWLYRFIQARKIPLARSLNFFSVFGKRSFVKYYPVEGRKIFFTGEDVYDNAFGGYKDYVDYCLNDVDLALGFDERGHTNYLKLPVWFFSLVNPNWDYAQLKENIEKINQVTHRSNQRSKFMCHLSRHDQNGMRAYLVNLFNQIETVSCAGKCLNNTDELSRVYQDNKLAYLRNFKFNLCPENTSVSQYVTEKCFEAIMAGCIPVYWGGGGGSFLNRTEHFKSKRNFTL